MATQFTYKVKDRAGSLRDGKIEADNPEAVERTLRSKGFIPLEIAEANTGMQREIRLTRGKKVKTKDLAIFARQFAVMTNSGLSLLRALTILGEQSPNETLRKILRQVKADVENGSSLSNALAKHPNVFPPLMVSMVRAGEMGGFLDASLMQVAQNYEAEVRLRGKIKAALTYPVAVFVMAILICTAMLIFVVPTFATMFDGLGGELPLPTRMLVALSNSLKFLGPLLLIGVIVGYFAWQRNKNNPALRAVVDPLKMRVPVFGDLFKKISIARFARNFSTLLSSGVPILQALDIVGETSGSYVVGNAVKEVQDAVRQGESITRPLAQHAIFPPMVVQMMAVGEDTGALDQMLAKIAEFYDNEVEATTEQLTALIEPLMIAFLGGIVGAMVIALYLPLFKVFDLISGA